MFYRIFVGEFNTSFKPPASDSCTTCGNLSHMIKNCDGIKKADDLIKLRIHNGYCTTATENETPASSCSMSIPYKNPEDSQNVEKTDIDLEQELPECHGSQVNIQADDISRWPEKITAEFINYWAGRGHMDLNHSDVKSLNDKSAIQKAANSVSRKCASTMFQQLNRNREVVKRSWLCFSPANGRVYCFFSSRAKKAGRIDSELAHEMDRHEHYWRSLLKRLISVLKFVCERGLALRGDNETIGSPNNGNYLELLELLAEYDDFLGQQKSCQLWFWSHKLFFIYLSLDSTADEGHVDQLTLIFRYMEQDRPVERFVKFLPNQGHKAEEMFRGLMNFLEDHDIDIQNCRGQSYDNASAMSGRYNGLQAKVSDVNHHDTLCWTFTKSASTNRYALLTDSLKSVESGWVHVPKRVSTTRWSCQSDAVKALIVGYHPIRNTLQNISENENETPKARSEANGLHGKMCKLETGIYAAFWHDIFARSNATSHILQDPKLDLNTAIAALKSLQRFVSEKRDHFCDFEEKGKEMSGTDEYIKARKHYQSVRLTPLDYGGSGEARLSPCNRSISNLFESTLKSI
ncbi:uncharacterized protein LOC136085499 [Hydra vulgaris]|uniref:Uncharacterized protein LOC136085499 n=1 Tax=Hydra vulgaris TaxID=6087 RepID=A0ABM4CM64_HYDVU